MARPGDIGPYGLDNVVCFTHGQNARDRSPEGIAAAAEKISATLKANGGPMLGVRGDWHYRSRAVLTPEGRFGSIELAAEALGISRFVVQHRARKGKPGWSYVDPLTPLDHFYQRLLIALAWVRSRSWHGPGPDFSFAEIIAAAELCRFTAPATPP